MLNRAIRTGMLASLVAALLLAGAPRTRSQALSARAWLASLQARQAELSKRVEFMTAVARGWRDEASTVADRADRLELGTPRAAHALLARPPEARWVEESAGKVSEELLWPVDGGRYGRGFGYNRRERRDLRHDGFDVVAPLGTPVRAVMDGLVAYTGNRIQGYGNTVLLVHPNGWVTLYAHLGAMTVRPGERVQRGQFIGEVGMTGITRGPHLHFELREGGVLRNPARRFTDLRIGRAPGEANGLSGG